MEPKYIIEDITIEEIRDDVGPPHPDIKPTFENLYGWLVDICDGERPQKPIHTFAFGVFESPIDRVMYLVGINKYGNYEKVDFEPKGKYFLLPQDEYKNLDRDQLNSRLTQQLRDFTNTQEFKNSFLAASTTILLSGQAVWTK